MCIHKLHPIYMLDWSSGKRKKETRQRRYKINEKRGTLSFFFQFIGSMVKIVDRHGKELLDKMNFIKELIIM